VLCCFTFLWGQGEKGFCLTDSFDLNPKTVKGILTTKAISHFTLDMLAQSLRKNQ
jgi:hypothetical protein